MKHDYTLLLILVFSGCIAISASKRIEDDEGEFSGKIVYSVMFESKSPLKHNSKLHELYGNTMTLYMDKGNYKMVFNGSYIKEVLYIASENRHYIKTTDGDSLQWRNFSQEESKYLRTHFEPRQDNILDRTCHAFSIHTDWGTCTYLYDPQLYVNPHNYKEKGYGYYNLYMRSARAPFLKCVYDGIDFRKTMIATEVVRMEPDSAFSDIKHRHIMAAGM